MGIQSSVPFIPDPDLPESDQPQLIAPFKCIFKGPALSDGFYTIPAKSFVNVPIECMLLVTDWSLSHDSGLNLLIKAAEVLDETCSERKIPEISIQNNVMVNESLRKFKYSLMEKIILDSVSIKSENSQNFLKNLDRINQEVEEGVASLSEEDYIRKPSRFNPVFEAIQKEKPAATINLTFDLGIEEFPAYALEYLKHKYNVV
jgi:hypothetical protein